ncbi:DNA uptake protein ComE-like DNA-binding protein [Flavobacterium sp. HSC-32F16]|uniref:ComEA family DNA-binding protein n=1 Tax=Flavobacterium sp. HSC-32F16 TaxID=2910964 RepID=UPI0020A3184A|nr:helix-hairpin-helix domain-containing protein [Flavobacterium sp. HSC-32F16]MCP2028866.1 DNA uptake protein ComE-like DNA-binding protein [Flavobacterium sp. HSC-32F16]
MNFKALNAYFRYTNQQRKGLFLFFTVVILLQSIYFFYDFTQPEENMSAEKDWLSLQKEVDAAKLLKLNGEQKVYTFNPNFISDYKGYKLGMSVQEIDRLLAFRKENKYVNSAAEFQEVTQISDSLLKVLLPLFKFPDWTQKKNDFKAEKKEYAQKTFVKKEKVVLIDINQAGQEDLIKVYGIGEALSSRILKQKEILGGFVSMEQLGDVWGLSPEVIIELNKYFKVIVPANFKKIPINDASLKELSQFPYFKYSLAKQIVTYRSMNGNFNNIEDLSKIKGFPVEKAKIISLYLEF